MNFHAMGVALLIIGFFAVVILALRNMFLALDGELAGKRPWIALIALVSAWIILLGMVTA